VGENRSDGLVGSLIGWLVRWLVGDVVEEAFVIAARLKQANSLLTNL
jgi:hypothetical protein